MRRTLEAGVQTPLCTPSSKSQPALMYPPAFNIRSYLSLPSRVVCVHHTTVQPGKSSTSLSHQFGHLVSNNQELTLLTLSCTLIHLVLM